MAKNLLIVESPAKSKTLKKILGKDFDVLATVGHIIDLPKSKIGVDVDDNFKPDYVVIEGKDKIIKQLRAAARNAEHIYLAPDPDREGEAIAWHVANSFKRSRITGTLSRIAFNAITKKAVTESLNNAREIDLDLVNAQQARRILDRIVGYKVSPFLWQTIARGLSAGRVQSVALRIICEREEEVRSFVPQEYWEIEVELANGEKKKFLAKLAKIDGKNPEISDQATADKVVDDLKKAKFTVADIKIGTKKRNPLPPFITSTIQQEAAAKLHFAPQKTMRVAQGLYEGIDLKGEAGTVGLITYMRTDSVRVEPEAISDARDFIKSSYGEDYLPEKPRLFKTKKSAQDAHEAIRPTYLEYSPDQLTKRLTKDQFKLYSLIWDRFIASQMNPAVYDTVSVDIAADQYLLRASSLNLKFDGYLRVYKESDTNGNGNSKDNAKPEIPALEKNEELTADNFNPTQHFTKPKPRFSEASLVKELESKGIGRPSTYAQIIFTLKSRKYVELNERRLIPTELGFAVTKILVENFQKLFDVSFTAEMEDELDNIEEGKIDWTKVLKDFYDPFADTMTSLKGRAKDIKASMVEKTDEKCENCGKPMVIKWGRNGRFLACSGYPECKTTRPINGEEETVETDEKCEKCGSPMQVKTGRFGKFLGCSNYPTCRHTMSITTGVACPKDGCQGEVVERKSKRGRTFFGCSKYPKCDFVSWQKPINEKCKACGHDYLVEKTTKAKGFHHFCPECKVVIYPEAESESSPDSKESVSG
ncbi:MAG: type I DNA topoisomerase, partial [FCB group bacterium]|nr:type I DNA topoisomerase [FCB group bacterium]